MSIFHKMVRVSFIYTIIYLKKYIYILKFNFQRDDRSWIQS